MDESQVIEMAKALRERAGGMIFAFPIEEDNPFSKYAVVVYMAEAGHYHVYPNAVDISVAASGVFTIMDLFKKEGIDIDYERDVRLVSYEAQINAPSTVMWPFRKELQKYNTPKRSFNSPKDDGEILLYAQGVLKLTYAAMIDENNPKATWFMNEYYKLLAMRKYGKTASAIRQEVRKMSKGEAMNWIDRTYKRYIHDDTEIMKLLGMITAQ